MTALVVVSANDSTGDAEYYMIALVVVVVTVYDSTGGGDSI